MPHANKPRSREGPKQARSLLKEERLLNAMEYLLTRQSIDEITVDAIAEKAHTSVGAFYKRFTSKEELLPRLLGRLEGRLHLEFENELNSPSFFPRPCRTH